MNQLVANPTETEPEQPFLSSEMAPPELPELDLVIKEYVKTRDKRMDAGKKEKDLNQRLLIMLRERNLREYTCGRLKCTITGGEEKISVKTVKDED